MNRLAGGGKERTGGDGFKKLLDQGKLQLPPDINENDARLRCMKARCRRWIVNRGQPTPRGGNVLTYFARYGRGGPLKESRLESFDGESVSFRENRRDEPLKILTWPVDVFLARLLRHVPPHNYRTLRSCGLYAPNACEKRQRARAALGQAAEPTEPAASKQDSELADHDRCEVCGRKLVLVLKIPRPPPKKRARSTRRTRP